MRPRTSIYPLFVLIWAILALVCSALGVLGQSATPIANLIRTNRVYATNIIPVVTHPGKTNGTMGLPLGDLLSSFQLMAGWESASVTNAISRVRTNDVDVVATATSINFVTGSNTVVKATNDAGNVHIQINASASGGGSGSVETQWFPDLTQFYTNGAGGFGLKSAAAQTNGTFQSSGITAIPMTIQGIAGQDGNLLNLKNYLGNILFAFSYDGSMVNPILAPGSTAGYLWTAVGTTGAGTWAAPEVTTAILNLATNGVFAIETTRNAAVSNAVVALELTRNAAVSNGVVAHVEVASSNRVRLAGGTGGITLSQSGSGGVQTWTINDDDAGSSTNFNTASFNTATVSNAFLFGVTNVAANTASIDPTGPQLFRYSPSGTFTLSFASEPPAIAVGRRMEVQLLTQQSGTWPSGIDWGSDGGAISISGATNRYQLIWTGTNWMGINGQVLTTGSGATVLSNTPSITSPALAGNPTTPTASPGDNDTTVASTAFVTAAVAAGGGSTNVTTLASGSLTTGSLLASNSATAGIITATTNITTPLLNAGHVDVRTNLNAAALQVTNTARITRITQPWVQLTFSSDTNCIIDLSLGNKFYIVLTTNIHFDAPINFPAAFDSQSVAIRVIENPTGAFNWWFNTNYWKSQVYPYLPIDTNANRVSWITAEVNTNNTLDFVQTTGFRP